MPEQKSNFLIPAIGAAVVVAGGVAGYLYFKGGLGDASSPLASAKVVPDEALMATFISTDPQSWSKLQQFGTLEAQNLIAKGLQDLNQQVLSESNIDYEKDLKPWVGSVMVALLPPTTSQSAQSAQNPNVLMVLGIKDKISALNFANKLKAEKGVKSQETDYKGEKIIETTGRGEPSYNAVLNNHLVVAPERKAVEQAIDTFKGEPSFASKEGANTIITKGVDIKNPIAQIYVPDYPAMTQQLLAANPNASQLPPATLQQLKQLKSFVAGVGVDDVGLRMKAIAKLDPEAIKIEYQPSPGKVLSQFPAETIAVVAGVNINRSWSTFVEQAKASPELQQGLDQARQQLLTSVNIDLDKDIFSWMNGEFAFAIIPANQGLLAPIGFGGALIFDTSDRTTAEATLSKLDAFAQSNFVSVEQKNVGGKDVTQWQVPQQGALLGHGWLDRDTVFVAVGSSVVDTLAVTPEQSLDKSETFKAVTDSLQKPNGGYFYLNMDRTMSITRNFMQVQNTVIPPETSAILDSIRGIGMTAISPDKTTSQMELLLALKPRTK